MNICTLYIIVNFQNTGDKEKILKEFYKKKDIKNRIKMLYPSQKNTYRQKKSLKFCEETISKLDLYI